MIVKIWNYVHEKSLDQDDRQFFSLAKFDGLQSSYSQPLHMQVGEGEVSQCDRLSTELGLDRGVPLQLALMAGLIHSNEIPYRDRQDMVQILKKFTIWLDNRRRRAMEIKRIVTERELPSGTEIDNVTSWQDVVGSGKAETDD